MTKQVLLLDDNADNRKLLYYALLTDDYEVYEAQVGSDVPGLLEQVRFDVAMLDIELPDINGLDLAERLHHEFPDLILIMLSANDSADRLTKAREVGARAYVIKPFNLARILEFLKLVDTVQQDMQVL